MCKKLKLAGYVECSALKNIAVDACFVQAVSF